MTIGLAILIVAILFLIDRNHVWPQVWRGVKLTLKVGAVLLILAAIGWGGYIAWSNHKERIAAAKAAADDAAWRVAFVSAATTCSNWENTHPIGAAVDWNGDNPVYPPNGCEGPLENAYQTTVTNALIASGKTPRRTCVNPNAPV